MRHIVICGLSLSLSLSLSLQYFPHYLINGTILESENLLNTKWEFDFLYNFRLQHFSFCEELNEI